MERCSPRRPSVVITADPSEQEARRRWSRGSALAGTEKEVSKWPDTSVDGLARCEPSSQTSSTVREWLSQMNLSPVTRTWSPGRPLVDSSVRVGLMREVVIFSTVNDVSSATSGSLGQDATTVWGPIDACEGTVSCTRNVSN
jgi:hypothetical protein